MRGNISMRHALAAVVVLLVACGWGHDAGAYSYAASGAEPLLDKRDALLGAIAKGDWGAAANAYDGMKPDITYLDQNDDPGIAQAFTSALHAKDGKAVNRALLRAYADEIERRLKGARDNLKNFQTAKILVVKAQRFYTAMAPDLAPGTRQVVETELKRALDAIGNPGVFGVGRKPADPSAFAKAHAEIRAALAGVGR